MGDVTFTAKVRSDHAIKVPYEAREALGIQGGDIIVLTVEKVIKRKDLGRD